MLITPIRAYKDNYIWLFAKNNQACVVDPGQAHPVLTYLAANHLQLVSIFLTHHHHDHSDGIAELIEHFPKVKIYGSHRSTVPYVNQPLKMGDKISVLENEFSVLEIPGHTLDHIAFYNEDLLFCGDTLFSAGCGRVFEGTYEQMYESLQALQQLNDGIKVYCGHEYTLANLQFAQQVEPNNIDIMNKIIAVNQSLQSVGCTLPSSMAEEKKINPFLRTHLLEVIKAAQTYAQQKESQPVAIFKILREWKNNYRGK